MIDDDAVYSYIETQKEAIDFFSMLFNRFYRLSFVSIIVLFVIPIETSDAIVKIVGGLLSSIMVYLFKQIISKAESIPKVRNVYLLFNRVCLKNGYYSFQGKKIGEKILKLIAS